MKNAFENKEIWFLTGSQDLYGEETLVQVADQSKTLVAALNDSGNIPVKIVWKETLKDAKAIRRTMLDATADDNVVGVITWMHTFSPSKMWINGLDVLRKPLLHFHTQANVDLPWDTIDFDFMNLNQSAHGDREHAYILSRMGIARETVVGHVSEEEVTKRIGTWSRACIGWNVIQNMNVVRFGDNMRNVADTDGDKTEATRRMGVHITPWSTNELVKEVDAVSDADAEALAAEYEELYDVVPELREGGDRHQSLVDAARQEIGIRKFLEDRDAEAFTTNFEDLSGLKQLPGLAAQRLMAEGYGFGPEGDWKTAILVRAVKAMSEGLPGGTALMEDYTYSLTPGAELLLGAHMLEICPTLTSQKPRLEIHPLGIGGKEDPVRMVFSADPGPAIVVSFVDLGTRFRMTANTINMVEPPAKMPNLPVAHAVWEPEPSLAVSAECWLESGGSHHTVLTSQVGLEVFRTFSDLSKIELAVIDESTTTWQFRDQLRWNDTSYRLGDSF